MLVKNWMHKPAVTINADDSKSDAERLFNKHEIVVLPVLKKGKFAGIVTERDLKRFCDADASGSGAAGTPADSVVTVGDVMTKDAVWIPEDYTAEEAAVVMLKHKVAAVPVIDDEGAVLGTIGQEDILRIVISLTGVEKSGIQFAVEVEDRRGSIKFITDTIRKYGGRIACVLTSYDLAPEGYRRAYIRIYGIDRFKLHRLKDSLKEKSRVLYMFDHSDARREIS